MIQQIVFMIDHLSRTVGHAFSWCALILTLGTCYEVVVRYVLNDPTSWAFDLSYLMYGAAFFMTGAYTLSRGGHVRADMFYRRWPERTQATVGLTPTDSENSLETSEFLSMRRVVSPSFQIWL